MLQMILFAKAPHGKSVSRELILGKSVRLVPLVVLCLCMSIAQRQHHGWVSKECLHQRESLQFGNAALFPS